MGESIKALLLLGLMVGTIGVCVVWIDPAPTQLVWGLRIGMTTLAVGCLIPLVRSLCKKDLAPDYLKRISRTYFNRDGFCFAVGSTAIEGVAFLDVYFQNQFERPCQAIVALRPARGFFLTREKFEAIAIRVDCPEAGFGVARFAIPIPLKLQGKRQRFEVGASVQFPQAKGARLRFDDGIFLRANEDFGDAFSKSPTVAYLAVGGIYFKSPATVQVPLPKGVAEDFEGDAYLDVRTLWKLDDPPLQDVVRDK